MTEQDKESKPAVIEVELDGEVKQFTAEDVKNLKSMQKSATEKFQKASPVLKAMESYGFDNTDDFLNVANFSIERFHQLMQDGVIDSDGNVLKQQDPDKPTGDVFNSQPQSSVNIDDIVNKALGRIEEKMSQTSTGMQDRINKLERVLAAKALKEKYPDLSDKQIGEVFMKAAKDNSKSFLEHGADVFNDSKTFLSEVEKRAEQKLAEKLGLSLDDLNKRLEQPPEGGASAIIAGKKPAFKNQTRKWGKKEVDPNAIDPKEAMKEFFKNQNFQ